MWEAIEPIGLSNNLTQAMKTRNKDNTLRVQINNKLGKTFKPQKVFIMGCFTFLNFFLAQTFAPWEWKWSILKMNTYIPFADEQVVMALTT